MENSNDTAKPSDPAAQNMTAVFVVGLIVVVLIAAIFAAIIYSKMSSNQ